MALGQPGLTSNTANNGGISASTSNGYAYPFYDETTNSLFISDQSNNRVLRFIPSGPTAASVTISGRVLGGNNQLVTKAKISLTDAQGITRTALVSPFGYYKFESVSVGETVTIQVSAKGYNFNPQVISATEDVEDLNFTAQ